MIKVSDLQSWGELASWLSSVQDERNKLRDRAGLYVSELLFRGHSNSDWKLQTTLERYGGTSDVKRYYEQVHAAKPQIESLAGRRWDDIRTPPRFNDWLDQQTAFGLFDLPAYDYLVYLRHHGFPSPLLDWSVSPYVAAFFAVRSAAPTAERFAIFAYLEHAGGVKGGQTSDPRVRGCGPYVRTHPRHFLQQSQYTLCVQVGQEGWEYGAHHAAFETTQDEPEFVWKATIPASERLLALKYLDQFNVNAYSLFGSEDALVETVAVREILFDPKA